LAGVGFLTLGAPAGVEELDLGVLVRGWVLGILGVGGGKGRGGEGEGRGRREGGGREAGKGREETDFSCAGLVLRTGSAACSSDTGPFAGPAASPVRAARNLF